MINNLPRRLVYFLLPVCLIFICFLVWANFSPTSPLNKKSSSVTPTPVLTLPSVPVDGLVRVKVGEKEFTAGENCSKLFTTFQELKRKALQTAKEEGREVNLNGLKLDYNSSVDVNQDKKVDFSDERLIMRNIKDEKWCREKLK